MTDKEKVETPIIQLSLLEPLTSLRAVKSADRKKEDVVVFDARIVRTLWCKMITVINEVNRLKKYITENPVSKWEAGINVMEEFAGKALIPKEEDVATIIQWHKDTFPKATCAGQLEKWEEERKEFDDAIDPTEKLKELVDMFIVACAIMRFNVPRGAACMTDVCALREHFNFSFLRWKEEIAKKMAKNRARKWEYMGNGNYHHVKGVED
jgi:hypothetical protein